MTAIETDETDALSRYTVDWQRRGLRLRAPLGSVGADADVHVRCPGELVARLRAEALAQDCTISQLVRRILRDALARQRSRNALRDGEGDPT
jgi:hypothetical protein